MVRTFQIEEISQLQDMIQETIKVSYPAYYPDRAVQFFRDYHSESKIYSRYELGKIVILKKNGEIVATGSLVENEISGVFVQPSQQRLGFGIQIMRALENHAAAMGVKEVELHVSLPSRKFYELLHYEISQLQHLDVGCGQYLKYWRGKKKLSY